MYAPLSQVERFALFQAALRIAKAAKPVEVVVPLKILTKQDISPKILHTPVRDEILESSAVRATSLLTSLLATLAAREASSETSGSTDII